MQIETRTKATIQQRMHDAILAHCDADIREAFGPHRYTMEPLLIQLIREMQHLRAVLGENTHANRP